MTNVTYLVGFARQLGWALSVESNSFFAGVSQGWQGHQGKAIVNCVKACFSELLGDMDLSEPC